MKLSEVIKDNSMVAFSTVNSAGEPKVRQFSHQFVIDGKICFATSNQGSTYAELQVNPNAELMQFARAIYSRISGKIQFATGEEKEQLLAKVADANPRLIEMYTPEGFAQKMEVGYFVEPNLKIVDYKTRQPIEVEVE